MKRLRTYRPSAAMTVACLALFVALGGVGYAAATINGNSIVNKTITGKKLKNGTLSGTQVKKNGLSGSVIKESTLGTVPKATAADLATTATNATNATKATTAETAAKATLAEKAVTAETATNATSLGGIAALQYLTGYQVVTDTSVSDATTDPKQAFATCPAGKVLVGGGSTFAGGGAQPVPVAIQRDTPSGPAAAPNQWFVQAIEVGAGTATAWSVTATAICVNAP